MMDNNYLRIAAPAYGAPSPPEYYSGPAKLVLMSNTGGKASEIFKLRKLFNENKCLDDLPLERAKYFSRANCPVVLLTESEEVGLFIDDLRYLLKEARAMGMDVEIEE